MLQTAGVKFLRAVGAYRLANKVNYIRTRLNVKNKNVNEMVEDQREVVPTYRTDARQ
jgi:hypothetical protein